MNEQHVSSSRLASEFDEKCAVKADKKMKYDLFAVVKPIILPRLKWKSRLNLITYIIWDGEIKTVFIVVARIIHTLIPLINR